MANKANGNPMATPKPAAPAVNGQAPCSTTPTQWKIPIAINGTVPSKLIGKLSYFFGKDDVFKPESIDFNVELEGGVETTTVIDVSSIDIKNPITPCGDDGTANKGILAIFLLGLGGGLIALLTPCVFPMIPVTVSFFTNRASNKNQAIRNGVLYGFFIFLIYICHLNRNNEEYSIYREAYRIRGKNGSIRRV